MTKYTNEYVRLVIDQSTTVLEEEVAHLSAGIHKSWEMNSAVVLEALNMAHKQFNGAKTNEDKVSAFVLIEALLEDYVSNVIPDPDVVIH